MPELAGPGALSLIRAVGNELHLPERFSVIPVRYVRAMELIMSTTNTLDIEQMLAEAGFDFAVVERCPVAGCEICDADDIKVAA